MKEKEGIGCMKRAEIFVGDEPRQQLERAYGRSSRPGCCLAKGLAETLLALVSLDLLERASFWIALLEQRFTRSNGPGLCPKSTSCTMFALVWMCRALND